MQSEMLSLLDLDITHLFDDPDDELPTSPTTSNSSTASTASSKMTEDSSDEIDFDEELLRIDKDILSLFLGWSNFRDDLADFLNTTRVLNDMPPAPRNSQFNILDDHYENREHEFRRRVRISPATFDALLPLIENHPIFHVNDNHPQLDVKRQFQMFLFRAGHYGNAASPHYIAEWAGVSVGTVNNCMKRVMVALLHLHDCAVRPPTAEEKEKSKVYTESRTCKHWRGGCMSADGTKCCFFCRPGFFGDAWFDKDKNYSMSLQVCVFILIYTIIDKFSQLVSLLHNCRIVDYVVGHTGSAHDSTAFQCTQIAQENERSKYLSDGEWIWVDSAYPLTPWCVAPYKKPAGGQVTKDQSAYNYYAAKVHFFAFFRI